MAPHSQPAPVPEPQVEVVEKKQIEITPAERKPRFAITIQGGVPI